MAKTIDNMDDMSHVHEDAYIPPLDTFNENYLNSQDATLQLFDEADKDAIEKMLTESCDLQGETQPNGDTLQENVDSSTENQQKEQQELRKARENKLVCNQKGVGRNAHRFGKNNFTRARAYKRARYFNVNHNNRSGSGNMRRTYNEVSNFVGIDIPQSQEQQFHNLNQPLQHSQYNQQPSNLFIDNFTETIPKRNCYPTFKQPPSQQLQQIYQPQQQQQSQSPLLNLICNNLNNSAVNQLPSTFAALNANQSHINAFNLLQTPFVNDLNFLQFPNGQLFNLGTLPVNLLASTLNTGLNTPIMPASAVQFSFGNDVDLTETMESNAAKNSSTNSTSFALTSPENAAVYHPKSGSVAAVLGLTKAEIFNPPTLRIMQMVHKLVNNEIALKISAKHKH